MAGDRELDPQSRREDPMGAPQSLARTFRRIRWALAAGVALAAGCGPGTIGSDDDTGEGDPSSGASSPTDGAGSTMAGPMTSGGPGSGEGPATSTGSGPATSSGAGGEDDGPLFDLGALPDFDQPPTSECFEPPPDGLTCDVPLERGQHLGYRCMPQEERFSCDGITPEEAMADAQDCLQCVGWVESVHCGPVPSGIDTCCHWFVWEEQPCPPGRPFTVDGRARLPGVTRRDDWAEAFEPRVDGLALAVREALAEAWANDGCYEHASIASFARFVMELLALGAPPSLVLDAQRAMGEEASHARALFGLASAYAGRALGPDTLEIEGALGGSHDPMNIAEGLAREGCIGETISALQMQVAAERVADPRVRARLQVIAEEELRHAELAWSALGWLVARSDARLRARVAQVFGEAARFVPRATDAADHIPAALLRAHGRLTRRERVELAERALERLIAPAAAQLTAPLGQAASPGCLA